MYVMKERSRIITLKRFTNVPREDIYFWLQKVLEKWQGIFEGSFIYQVVALAEWQSKAIYEETIEP